MKHPPAAGRGHALLAFVLQGLWGRGDVGAAAGVDGVAAEAARGSSRSGVAALTRHIGARVAAFATAVALAVTMAVPAALAPVPAALAAESAGEHAVAAQTASDADSNTEADAGSANASADAPANATAEVAAMALPPTSPRIANVPPGEAGKLAPDAQVAWLVHAAKSGLLEKLDDGQLVSLFESLDPLTLPRYLATGSGGYPSCEFTMWRSERVRGIWPGKPDHMLVRLTHDPLRIYAKWLPDGAHAGQEVLYDASKRRDEMYGHLGGLLNVMPLWASLDGVLARAQSNHRVTDLGTAFIVHQYLTEGRKFAEAGITHPSQIEVKTMNGVRVVAFTWETPTGRPAFYAKKEVLGLDLRHPWFRTIESYDNDGRIFERIVFEHISPKTFDDLTFDPKNPEYRF
jgi:hypothetical protein